MLRALSMKRALGFGQRNITRNLATATSTTSASSTSNLASTLPITQTSTLSNGLTVASEYIPHSSTATVGIWIDAGSRAENAKNNGTAHFLEHLAFKGTTARSQLALELEIEDLGAHLNAYTSRENTVYYAKSTEKDIPNAINVLSDILTKSTLEPKAIERERDVIIRESEEVDKMYDEVVFDHLHAICYKNQPLGRTILGPLENIRTIQRDDLKNYIEKNYAGDRMVLVGTGSVNHEDLVKYADKYFNHLKPSPKKLPLGTPRGELPVFHGDEIKIQDDSIPNTHLAIAVEGVSWSGADYFTALVTQSIVGNWDRSLGTGSNSPSQLALNVANGINGEPLANSYMSFSTSYSDTGLWGVYLTADKSTDLKNVLNEITNEWNRLKKGDITDDEIKRAKAQLKASLLLSLDGSTAIAEDIGRQIVTTGKRLSPEEVFEKVDVINKDDVVNWANYRLKDKPVSIAAVGTVHSLPPLKDIRKALA
ncbi:Mitochondrial-processing peptidase subunit beta [Wickerhamomyces ciferrii]|uniref:mitochondrial processing peptidase n=1 Tax=Wickerhamomyces ciferrii (strain ATCC 14091 / BCRC 22168 / CBS 111 / JCM 3599 / NBRC 0793 / NRRL Y-1031 F-60-10) TaxID=1206466 RepID=K0KPU2_WICCF|nr:Mitochondrial-processing peptidase subunit beta [Wickerhamomyces ciferrii]CCH43434.1 Mitochondrial-processing peptidase subunit beta [Wickerhamomyces ciferrii]